MGLTMTRKTIAGLMFGATLALGTLNVTGAAAQSGPICSKFDSGLDSWAACSWAPNVTTTTTTSGGIGTNDPYLQITDKSGASRVCSSDPKYLGNWVERMGGCGQFCFDFKVTSSGLPPALVTPSFTIHSGANKATFYANFQVAIGDTSWHQKICAPIMLGESAPPSPNGHWVISGGTWNSIVTSVTQVSLPIDFTSSPSEVVGYDNICMSPGGCGEKPKDEITGCLKDAKVEVKCNADGTYTVTLSGAGTAGDDITLTSQTAGVTVSPTQQPWAASTTWTVVGATPGQLISLTANATKVGGGSAAGADQCCNGEIKIVMPDCNPKPPIDLKVEKENTPAGGQGNGFNVWVTNVGAPITFAPGELTVKDAIPAGLNIFTQSSPNWTCIPIPATGPATINCTYNLAGSLGTGAQLTDSLVFTGVLTNHEQPLKNCAVVSIPVSVGVDTNPSNNEACVTIQDLKVGELIFTKHAVYLGPILLPPQTFTVNVLCGTNTTTLSLVDNVPQTIGNILYGTSCSYNEPTPAVPPGVCPAGRTGVWTTAFVPPPSVTINTPVRNVDVNNTLTCEQSGDGILRVQKQVNQNGYEFKVSNLTFPATVTCGGTTYPLTLSILAQVTVGPLPLGTNCSVSENVSTIPIPPDTCAAGTTGSWLATTSPASVPIGTTPTTIVVVNTLVCSPNQSTTDLGINKTGGTTPAQQPYYVFDMTVTNHGSAINPIGAVVVTDTVPANMTFNSIGGPGWVCMPPGGPAGTVIKCSYSGSVAAGHVLPVIHVDATASGEAPYPPVTNCAQVAPATTSGLTDMNPGNNNSCVTLTKPRTCTPPQVSNSEGVCVYPPPPRVCPPPMVPGPVAGQCICGPGYVMRGRECVKTIVCRPPLVANAADTDCVCRRGLVLRQGKCVEPIVCREPATLNRAGTGCMCPKGWVKKGNSCEREREQPRITPKDVIRNLPGIFPGSGGRERRPSGSSDGGRGTPGVR